jgi:hypothetical protein
MVAVSLVRDVEYKRSWIILVVGRMLLTMEAVRLYETSVISYLSAHTVCSFFNAMLLVVRAIRIIFYVGNFKF